MKHFFLYIICKFIDIIFGKRSLSGVPIIFYHGIGKPKSKLQVLPVNFEKQIKYLFNKGYKAVLPQDLEKTKKGEKFFLITFDDAFKSVYQKALPVLKKYGYCGAVFISTDYIGKKTSYAGGGKNKNFDLLNVAEIQALKNEGWFVGSHFASHKYLPTVPVNEVRKDYLRSDKHLKDIGFERAGKIIAYPFNFFNKQMIDVLKRAGVKIAFAGGNRLYTEKENKLCLPRFDIDNNFFRFALVFSPTFHKLKSYVPKK